MTQRDDRQLGQWLDSLPAQPSPDHDRTVLQAADRLLTGRPAPRRSVWRTALALAASVLVALPLGLVLVDPPQPVVTRGSLNTVVPGNDTRQAAAPAFLSWPASSGALGYRVVLRDETAAVLWTSAVVTETRVTLPEAVRRSVSAMPTVIWSVEVTGETAQREIGPYWFHLN